MSLWPFPRRLQGNEIVGQWFDGAQAVATLSVRSGFDLLLKSLDLPKGSEIIVSAINIPDMFRIIEHHGYRCIPIDVNPDSLEPSLAELERAISPKTKAILVSHLFGSLVEMQPIIALAQRHQLLVIEDCAQAFVGHSYAGNPDSDVAMFSFGPIKTATALGGAILRVRNPELRANIQSIQNHYHTQTRFAFIKRIFKFATLKAASAPGPYGMLVAACRLLSIDYDQWIGSLGHSFPKRSFFEEIRQKPTGCLLHLLARRLRRFEQVEHKRIRRRTRIGQLLSRSTQCAKLNYPGNSCRSHSFWVLAVITQNSKNLIRQLRREGFDATNLSSMVSNSKNSSRIGQDNEWLDRIVYLPIDPSMPASIVRRLKRLLKATGRETAV